MSEAINIKIIKEVEFSYTQSTPFKVIIKATPEFMREPEFMITDEEKIEIIAQKVKEAFIENLSNNVL